MGQEKLLWAIDFDDVIIPTAEVLVPAYNERYGTSVQLEGYYGGADAWNAPTPKDVGVRINELLRDVEIVPTDETIEALSHLATMDELHIVTGRPSSLEEPTHRMLKSHFPGVFTSVEFTNYSHSEASGLGTRSKGDVCNEIGADILVDDHIAHGTSVLDSGLEEVIVWGNYPWNRDQKLGRGMVRCIRWGEVLRERERILAGRK